MQTHLDVCTCGQWQITPADLDVEHVIIGGKLYNTGFNKVTFLAVTVETASPGTVCKPACDALATH